MDRIQKIFNNKEIAKKNKMFKKRNKMLRRMKTDKIIKIDPKAYFVTVIFPW